MLSLNKINPMISGNSNLNIENVASLYVCIQKLVGISHS